MFSPGFWSGNKPVLYLKLFTCTLISWTQLTAQVNLVPNGSFEEYDYCPTGISDLSLKNWISPTWGTSDYFNSCNNNQVDIPDNYIGNQEAHSGTAFCGIGACYEEPNLEVREYIQVELLSPLIPNQLYSFSCFLSLAERVKYCVNDIGIAISDDPIGGSYTHAIDVSETFYSSSDDYNCDTIEWNKINIYFIAKGGEKYLTLGQFNNDVDVEKKIINPQMTGCVYYYIDDVNLNEYIFPELPNVFTPNGDGINDTWNISDLEGFELSIVNRWGNQIVRTTIIDSVFSWDGRTEKGIDCVDGVYFYSLEIKDFQKTGFIHLVR